MNYTTEVEFLRAEVEKCHASMQSQIETISLLMKKNIALKEQKREWVGLTKEEAKEISMANRPYVIDMIAALEARLKEKNT